MTEIAWVYEILTLGFFSSSKHKVGREDTYPGRRRTSDRNTGTSAIYSATFGYRSEDLPNYSVTFSVVTELLQEDSQRVILHLVTGTTNRHPIVCGMTMV